MCGRDRFGEGIGPLETVTVAQFTIDLSREKVEPAAAFRLRPVKRAVSTPQQQFRLARIITLGVRVCGSSS